MFFIFCLYFRLYIKKKKIDNKSTKSSQKLDKKTIVNKYK